MADVPRNSLNTWFQRENHIKLKKEEYNRSVIFDSAVQRAATLGKLISDGTSVITVTPAGVAPASQPLTHGDLVSSITNFATIDNVANFESTAGTITSVEWISAGLDRAGSYALQYADSLIVRVTDSAANVRNWTIDNSIAGIAPTRTVSLGAVTGGQTIGKPSSGADVEAVLGGSVGVPAETLVWEYNVNGGVYVSLDTPYASIGGETVVIRISDTSHPTGSFSSTSTPVIIDFGTVDVVYTVGSLGDPATLTVTVPYAGAGTLTAYAATGTNPITVSDAQLKTAAGGTNTIEFFNFIVTPGGDTDDIIGLTSASDSADRIILIVSDGTIDSAQVTTVVSGLDFTPPQFSSASTTVGSSTITVTITENVYSI